MSANRCPVCSAPKDQRWHLVCATCWAKVPFADQQEVYRLYKEQRGSTAHTLKCRTVVRALCVAQREAAQPARKAGTPDDLPDVEDGCCPRCAWKNEVVQLEYSERLDRDICPQCGYS
ncbi:MAG: hypothetical protein HZA93_13105 [Verrucomicrobia bacterium]|nr:hypothetical protein [Verrucomicrobiota bacterium]